MGATPEPRRRVIADVHMTEFDEDERQISEIKYRIEISRPLAEVADALLKALSLTPERS